MLSSQSRRDAEGAFKPNWVVGEYQEALLSVDQDASAVWLVDVGLLRWGWLCMPDAVRCLLSSAAQATQSFRAASCFVLLSVTAYEQSA
jgi:hypothetical protein